MLGGGTSRCLWLGGDGATSPMEKRACKRSSNFYGKSNVNVINENSTGLDDGLCGFVLGLQPTEKA
jgi:hypothetical protein